MEVIRNKVTTRVKKITLAFSVLILIILVEPMYRLPLQEASPDVIKSLREGISPASEEFWSIITNFGHF